MCIVPQFLSVLTVARAAAAAVELVARFGAPLTLYSCTVQSLDTREQSDERARPEGVSDGDRHD